MPKGSPQELPSHGYPNSLGAQAWQDWPSPERTQLGIERLETLTGFLSVAYQASLLNEEGRPVVCRLALCPPSALEAQDLFLYGFHVSRFCQQRPFDEQEIRRLSPAATFYRSIMAVTWSSRNGFTIFGTVATGQWSRDLVADLQGMIHSIPNWLIVHIRVLAISSSIPAPNGPLLFLMAVGKEMGLMCSVLYGRQNDFGIARTG